MESLEASDVKLFTVKVTPKWIGVNGMPAAGDSPLQWRLPGAFSFREMDYPLVQYQQHCSLMILWTSVESWESSSSTPQPMEFSTTGAEIIFMNKEAHCTSLLSCPLHDSELQGLCFPDWTTLVLILVLWLYNMLVVSDFATTSQS